MEFLFYISLLITWNYLIKTMIFNIKKKKGVKRFLKSNKIFENFCTTISFYLIDICNYLHLGIVNITFGDKQYFPLYR